MAKNPLNDVIQFASGLGETTLARAAEVANVLVSLATDPPTPGDVSRQVSAVAEELLTAARGNRKHLIDLVRREVDDALAKADPQRMLAELATLRATVMSLGAEVEKLTAGERGSGPNAAETAQPAPAPRRAQRRPARASFAQAAAGMPQGDAPSTAAAPATKAATTKATAKRTTARKATAKKASATKASAKKASATKATAKKASATKATAKKASATKATAKKASATTTTATKAPTANAGSDAS